MTWPTPEEFRAQLQAQEEKLLALAADFALKGPIHGFRAAPKHIRLQPPSEAEFWAIARDAENPLLCGFLIFVLYRVPGRKRRDPRRVVAAAYHHRDYGALLSRQESPANDRAIELGELYYVPFGPDGEPRDWPSPEAIERAKAFIAETDRLLGAGPS